MNVTKPLTLGALSHVGVEPLLWGLDEQAGVTLVRDDARSLVERFATGELDCALLPPMAAASQLGGRVIPGIGLCSHGSTRSERLVARTVPAGLTKLAVAPEVGASAVLGQFLVAEASGVLPELIEWPGSNGLPEGADALIVSGSLEPVDPEGCPWQFDLGSLWEGVIDLPFVHAVWLGRLGAPYPRLRRVLSLALRSGLDNLDAVVQRAASARGIEPVVVDDYLRHVLHYTMGSDEMDGLRAMLELAVKYEVCGPDAGITLC
jgi:predicted solute-binding protein